MPIWVTELIQLVGLFGFIVVMIALIAWVWSNAGTRRMNASTKTDETVTAFAIDFNVERRQWQERHDKLQDEFTTFRIEQAKKEGGLEVLEKMLNQERDQRRIERDGFDEKFRKLDTRVQELERNNKQGLDKIQELETERDEKNKIIAELTTRNNSLEADNLAQKTTIEQLTNKANTLSELVERLQFVTPAAPTNTTQPIPSLNEVDDTFVPDVPGTDNPDTTHTEDVTSAATAAAEEQKP